MLIISHFTSKYTSNIPKKTMWGVCSTPGLLFRHASVCTYTEFVQTCRAQGGRLDLPNRFCTYQQQFWQQVNLTASSLSLLDTKFLIHLFSVYLVYCCTFQVCISTTCQQELGKPAEILLAYLLATRLANILPIHKSLII